VSLCLWRTTYLPVSSLVRLWAVGCGLQRVAETQKNYYLSSCHFLNGQKFEDDGKAMNACSVVYLIRNWGQRGGRAACVVGWIGWIISELSEQSNFPAFSLFSYSHVPVSFFLVVIILNYTVKDCYPRRPCGQRLRLCPRPGCIRPLHPSQ
jgi:hypothetical protein